MPLIEIGEYIDSQPPDNGCEHWWVHAITFLMKNSNNVKLMYCRLCSDKYVEGVEMEIEATYSD